MVSESKGAKKRRKLANTVKLAERKATRERVKSIWKSQITSKAANATDSQITITYHPGRVYALGMVQDGGRRV